MGVAWVLYRRGIWQALAARPPGIVVRLLRSGFGFDAVYGVLLEIPYLWLVRVLRQDPVDLIFVALERSAVALHLRLRGTQNGRIRRYAGWLMAGSVATVAMLLFG
jgi:NADH-quinone oxidoreductase subunit L